MAAQEIDIELRHVVKEFPGKSGETLRAVDNISFNIYRGEFFAMLGPSGCGKTTTLRMIAGFEDATSGQILLRGKEMQNVPPFHRPVNTVFQDYALFPHMTVLQNVMFGLEMKGVAKPEARKRAQKALEMVRLNQYDRKPRQLSGGERQRVGVARALARDPRIFLFDEPFSNLDAKLRTQARVELRRLLNAFPVTSVYVTHDQVEAMALADRIAVMRAGRLEQIGSYQALHDNPVNLFVAGFIGLHPINLFEGHAGEHQWLGPCFSGLPLRGDLPSDMRVTLGLRPAHIRLAAASTPGAVAAQVETTTPFFAERHLMLEVIAGETRFSFATPIDSGIRPGDTVHCAAEAAGALFFDSGSGQRIG